jgi:hypothetical protein
LIFIRKRTADLIRPDFQQFVKLTNRSFSEVNRRLSKRRNFVTLTVPLFVISGTKASSSRTRTNAFQKKNLFDFPDSRTVRLHFQNPPHSIFLPRPYW